MKKLQSNRKKLSLFFTLGLSLISLFSFNRSMAQNKITNAEKLGFPKGKKVLLLHCDDVGMCEEANIAAQSYFLKGDIRSAAIMVPCPNAEAMINGL